MNHPFNPVIELLLVVATLVALYGLSLLAARWHRSQPEASPEDVPAYGGVPYDPTEEEWQ